MTIAFPTVTDNRLGPWLDNALDGVPHARTAVLGTMDGLVLARSGAIPGDRAEPLAASVCGSVSLAVSQATLMGDGPWIQSITEFGEGYMLILAAGRNAFLVATAGRDVDMGVLSFALQTLITRLGPELDSPSRTDTASAT